jgi:hypothetical protein
MLLLPDVLQMWNYLLKNPHSQEMGTPQLKKKGVILCARSNVIHYYDISMQYLFLDFQSVFDVYLGLLGFGWMIC